MIPFVITISGAAAPQSSLVFMFWGGVIVFPLMLFYTVISYSVFRGKIRVMTDHH
jgi:cytochrome d ubiquinol oxidase subunit II